MNRRTLKDVHRFWRERWLAEGTTDPRKRLRGRALVALLGKEMFRQNEDGAPDDDETPKPRRGSG